MEDPAPFSIDVSRVGDALLVVPAGEIDIATVPAVREALNQRPADTDLLVLDLSRVDFMDTSGLQLLVEQMRDCESGPHRLAVVRGPLAVQRLLDIAGLTSSLRLVDTAEEALANGKAGSP